MLQIKDIGQNNVHLKNSKLSTTKLWLKTTNDVFPLDLQIYLRQRQDEGQHDLALREIEELQRETILAMLKGNVSDAPFLSFTVKNNVRMTLGEFASILYFSELPANRQKAIMFSLETGMKPEDVITLTWALARKMPLSEFAKSIMNDFPRSINVNYVFWERFEDFGMVGPMFGLSQDFANMFEGMSHREVFKLFQTAIPVNQFQDAVEFKNLMKAVVKGA